MENALRSKEFVKKMFGEYYQSFDVADISYIENREFGFLTFDGKGMLRHIAFKSANELKSFLGKTVPSDAYFSCAYYEEPEAEMTEKGWLGADLVFDIDADHIQTPCNKIHDKWTCLKCGFSGKGSTPENCPICNNQKFEVKTWTCESCLDSAKTEAVKLLDMLTQDFGFSRKEVNVAFSGNRGYHVHVESEDVKNADTVARKEIVDYVSGLGLDIFFELSSKKERRQKYVFISSDLNTVGWRGRAAKGMKDLILNAKREDYENLGLKNRAVDAMIRNKEAILKSLDSGERLLAVKGVGSATLKKIIEFSINMQSAKIDTVVTTDVHRLIRLDNTLHSKTGLKKVQFPSSMLENFDALKEAVAFESGKKDVYVSEAPEFRLGDETFGPYQNQKIELPLAVALLLCCKGRAEVVE